MRIRHFCVSGYKNLTHPVQLRDLDPVTVFYGANNVGKSNLLEAIALPFLGTGVQQLVYLLGELCTSGASILLIEEPEANLTFDLQMRLRGVLREIATDPLNPSQLIFTSHSPGFQTGDHFFFMEDTEHGPQVRRRASDQLALATGLSLVTEAQPQHTAPHMWVTRDGLVRLPEEVRAQLGVLEGGGVAFLRDAERPGYRIMSDAQALKEIGWSDEVG